MASLRPNRPTRWDRPKAADDAEDADPVFRFFPLFPPEIRCMIWEFCLPHRVVELDFVTCNSWAVCEFSTTSVTNGYPPLISRVCREAREVALRRGVDMEWPRFAAPARPSKDAYADSGPDSDSDPDSDSEPEPEPEPAEDSDPDIDPGASSPPGKVRHVNPPPWLRPGLSYHHYNQPWIQPRRDILHLHWTPDANPVDDIWDVSDIADLQLLHYLQTRVQAPAISIQANLVLSFCRRWSDRRNWADTYSNLFKILARRDEYMAVVETVVLHVDPDANVATLSGLFGFTGDSRIQLVDPDDSAAMDQYRKFWWLHGSALDKDAERFFVSMMPKHGMVPDIRTRVAQWRRDVVKVWIWHRWRRHRLRDRQSRPELRTDSVWLGEDSWDGPHWNATRPGPLFHNHTRPWAIDMATREPNYDNPWVQRTRQKMPRFHPMIMFRICGMDCERQRLLGLLSR